MGPIRSKISTFLWLDRNNLQKNASVRSVEIIPELEQFALSMPLHHAILNTHQDPADLAMSAALWEKSLLKQNWQTPLGGLLPRQIPSKQNHNVFGVSFLSIGHDRQSTPFQVLMATTF